MAHRTEIKYRSFDELLAAIRDDFPSQDKNGFIEPSQLIKVAVRVNRDLNVAFHRNDEDVIEIENFRAKLPSNFHVLNFATLCCNGQREWIDPLYRHDHIEGKCIATPICDDECNVDITTELEITKNYRTTRMTWKQTIPLTFIDSNHIRTDCPNRSCQSEYTAYIKDCHIMTNVDNDHIYINYTPVMEDMEGDLLVLDHDMINSYYENALKVKILENMLMLGEDVVGMLKYYKEELRKSRIEARSIAGNPGFYQLVDYFNTSRKHIINKYFNIK